MRLVLNPTTGRLLLAPSGQLAGSQNCCCEGVSVCCCPGLIPRTLVAQISNKTGDCSCLPDTVTLGYIGPVDYTTPERGRWEGGYASCGGCSLALTCMDDNFPTPPADCHWYLGPSSCAAVVTLVSESCNPFQLVFDVDNSLGGATNCTGTYRVTITG